jgi:hypothetical protein
MKIVVESPLNPGIGPSRGYLKSEARLARSIGIAAGPLKGAESAALVQTVQWHGFAEGTAAADGSSSGSDSCHKEKFGRKRKVAGQRNDS